LDLILQEFSDNKREKFAVILVGRKAKIEVIHEMILSFIRLSSNWGLDPFFNAIMEVGRMERLDGPCFGVFADIVTITPRGAPDRLLSFFDSHYYEIMLYARLPRHAAH
jgi:hypothetical protein